MTVAFTLCSINYLGQAKTLYDSIKKTNPSLHFIIGLVDKNVNHIDLSFLGCEVLEVEKVPIDGFQEMVELYSIVELITAVKPFYFTNLFKTRPQVDKIIYFDPDIMVFNSLHPLETTLAEKDIILTPHFTKPIDDNLLPTEKHVFNTGVFNLGFLAVKRSENTLSMLAWWGRKLRWECIIDLTRGYFVDQLWMNLVPAYFDNVVIDKNPGYNVAHWNLHERFLSQQEDTYYVNNSPLIFFHFSHYNPGRPDEIAAYHTRYSFDNRPDIHQLFSNYKNNLVKNNFFELKKIPCFYMHKERRKKMEKTLKSFLRKNLSVNMKMKLSKLLQG